MILSTPRKFVLACAWFWLIVCRIEDGSDQWLPAKVQEVDKDKRQVLVHFMQWNSRRDEWLATNSPRLRPLRSSARLDSNGITPATPPPSTTPTTTTTMTTPATTDAPPLTKDFKIGDKARGVLCLENSSSIAEMSPKSSQLQQSCFSLEQFCQADW